MFVLCSRLCCSVELFVAVLWSLFVGSVFVCAVLFWCFVLFVFIGFRRQCYACSTFPLHTYAGPTLISELQARISQR